MPDPAEQAFDMTPLAASIVSASAPVLDDESDTLLDSSVQSVAGLVMHSKAFLSACQEISGCLSASVGVTGHSRRAA
jgi:hypothetical protein